MLRTEGNAERDGRGAATEFTPWCCYFLGAERSSTNIASMNGLNSASRGDVRTGTFRAGGSACANATRTVARVGGE